MKKRFVKCNVCEKVYGPRDIQSHIDNHTKKEIMDFLTTPVDTLGKW